MGVSAQGSFAPPYYGGGATHVVPNANSAFALVGATPSVWGKTYFRCGGSTAITGFTDVVRGQKFYVLGNGAVAVTENSSIALLSGATQTLTNGKWYTFINHDGVVTEVDLSSNLSAVGTLNFGSVSAQSYEDLTITVTGAAAGSAVALGVPTASVTAGIAFTAWVSAADTVTVRAHNYTGGALNPGSGNFKAVIVS